MDTFINYVLPLVALPASILFVRTISAILLFRLPFTRRIGVSGIHDEPARSNGLALVFALALLLFLAASGIASLWYGQDALSITLLVGTLFGLLYKNPGKDPTRWNLRRYTRLYRKHLDPDRFIAYVSESTGDPALVVQTARIFGRGVEPADVERLMREAGEQKAADARLGKNGNRVDGDVLPVVKAQTWSHSLDETQETMSDNPNMLL